MPHVSQPLRLPVPVSGGRRWPGLAKGEAVPCPLPQSHHALAELSVMDSWGGSAHLGPDLPSHWQCHLRGRHMRAVGLKGQSMRSAHGDSP